MYCFISFATCWSQRTFHLNLRVTSTLPSVFASFRKMPGISMGGAGLLARFDELLLTCELSWWRHNGRVSGQTIPHALLKVSIVTWLVFKHLPRKHPKILLGNTRTLSIRPEWWREPRNTSRPLMESHQLSRSFSAKPRPNWTNRGWSP